MFAVVFPGQGAQQPGMGRDLAETSEAAARVFDRASEALGLNVRQLLWESDEDTLRATQNAQPALYVSSLAAWEALREAAPNLAPSAMAGHSVGEFAALAAGGWMSLEDGARLVRRRGEIMAESGRKRPGTMAAVLGLEADELERVCAEASTNGVCVVANDNCPGQLVMSGDLEAVATAGTLAIERGAKRVIPLNVSGAFHSPLMRDSAEILAKDLAVAKFCEGQTPVFSNVTAEPAAKNDPGEWRSLLRRQLESPVRWRLSVQNMRAAGIQTFVECGVGEVLTVLLRRIDKSATGLRVVDAATLSDTAGRLAEVAA